MSESRQYQTEKDAMDILRWGEKYGTRMMYDPLTKKLRVPTETGVLVAKPGDYILRDKHHFTRVRHDEYVSNHFHVS